MPVRLVEHYEEPHEALRLGQRVESTLGARLLPGFPKEWSGVILE